MERSLAHIEQIVSLSPIEGADFIEAAIVLGWQLVVKKGEFQVGDYAVYIEIDSILPERPEFEFMRERKFRVRTIKLRKTISQGILFPLSILPVKYRNKPLGFDCTEILEIKKYETPTEKRDSQMREPEGWLWRFIKRNRATKWLSRYKWFRSIFYRRQKRSTFPPWIVKSDETRLQNIPHILSTPGDFYITEKLDGCSFTAYLKKPNEFGICSRNQRRDKDVGSVWYEVAKKYNIKEVLNSLIGEGQSVVLQGEIVGPNIQGNKYGLTGLKLFVFNVIIDGEKWNPQEIQQGLLNNEVAVSVGLESVPIIMIRELLPTVDLMVKFSNGKSVLNPSVMREGIVCRQGDISFKVVSPEFLLKYEQ
jgi:hypothetical protein